MTGSPGRPRVVASYNPAQALRRCPTRAAALWRPPAAARALPAAVRPVGVSRTHSLQGMRMTYRRETIRKEQFDELLRRYAAAGDFDARYRVSRRGALLNALRARLYHARDPSARL